jgi:hypothetical protein
MFRRHSSWYTKGFRGSAKLRSRLMRVTTLPDLEEVLRSADPDEPFPPPRPCESPEAKPQAAKKSPSPKAS